MFSPQDIECILTSPLLSLKTHESSDWTAHPYVPSRSGKTLISFSASQKKLLTHINTHGSLPIARISGFLDIKDPTPILDWADRHQDLATPLNRRDSVAPWQQKVIALHFYNACKRGMITLSELQAFWGLSATSLRDLIRVYSTSFPPVRDLRSGDANSCWTSERWLSEVRRRIVQTCEEAERTATTCSLIQPDVHHEVLAAALSELRESSEPVLQRGRVLNGGTSFNPSEAKARREQEVKAAQLRTQGWCKANSVDLSDKIQGAFGAEEVLRLYQHTLVGADEWPEDDVVLVKIETLREILDGYNATLESSEAVSDTTRSYQDFANAAPEIERYILLSTEGTPIREAYTALQVSQGETAQRALYTHLRTHVLIPLTLYTNPLSVCAADETLLANQQAFLLSHLQPLLTQALNEIQSAARQEKQEIFRFRTTLSAPANIDALVSAGKRLARKTRPATIEDDAEDEWRIRDDMLKTRVEGIEKGRVKRESDLLQQTAWVLLSAISDVPGLWVSAGKDTARVLKALRRVAGEQQDKIFDWVGAAEKLLKYRDAVKKGTQTAEDTVEVRKLAVDGFAARVHRHSET